MRPSSVTLPMTGSRRAFLSRPAKRRSSMLLPAPEGPKITVQSEERRHSISRRKLPRRALKLSSSTSFAPALFPFGIENCQCNHAEGEEDGGSAAGGGVVEVFDLVIEDDGEGAGGAGDVAAEHEDYSEFADGVEEAEDCSGDQRSTCEGDEEGKDD